MRRRALPYAVFPRDLPSKVLIKVGYACNSDCLFCHVDHYRGAPKSEQAIVLKKMALIKRKGFDMVALSGGEVTIRPDLDVWAPAAAKYGLQLGLVSNGRKMADRDYTRLLYSCGLRYAYISFYGATPEVHNFIAGGMDCWQKQVDGVRNLAAYADMDLTLNVILCKQTLPELRGIIDLFADIHHLRIKFSALEPKGAAWDNFQLITPPLAEAAEAAYDAIAYGEELARARGNLLFGIDGIPPCLVGDDFHATHLDNLLTHGIYYMTETWEDTFHHVDDWNKKHLPECRSCGLAHRCPGVPLGYEQYPEMAVVRPFASEGSTEIPLTPGEPLAPWTGTCPSFNATEAPAMAAGETWVATRDGIRLAHVAGSVGEMRWNTRTIGQVALREEAGAPLRKLPVHSECADCAWSVSCGLLFDATREIQPAPLNDRVREVLAGVKGRVLDVGGVLATEPGLVGHWRYDAAIEMLPDPEDTEAYDVILVLEGMGRFNATENFRTLGALLRPGGTLIAAQRVASLVIGPVGPAPERWRDASSQHFILDCEDAGMAVERHEPVQHHTGPEWLVVLRRQFVSPEKLASKREAAIL